MYIFNYYSCFLMFKLLYLIYLLISAFGSLQWGHVSIFFFFFFITKLKYRSDKCEYLIVTYL